MYLIGCKSDLDCEVATDEIILYAQKNDITYHQTSSLNGEGVHEAFRNIMINCAQKEIQIGSKNVEQKQNNLALTENNMVPVKKTCC